MASAGRRRSVRERAARSGPCHGPAGCRDHRRLPVCPPRLRFELNRHRGGARRAASPAPRLLGARHRRDARRPPAPRDIAQRVRRVSTRCWHGMPPSSRSRQLSAAPRSPIGWSTPAMSVRQPRRARVVARRRGRRLQPAARPAMPARQRRGAPVRVLAEFWRPIAATIFRRAILPGGAPGKRRIELFATISLTLRGCRVSVSQAG